MPKKIADDDWAKQDRYTVTASGCWEWKGGVCKDGYGKCGTRAGQTLAHRAYYVILKGPIPEGLEIDHTCKNRLCVNPDHLEAITHAENVARGDYITNHRNAVKTHCSRGHEFNDENTIWEKTASGKLARKCRACKNSAWRARNKRAA